MNMGLKRGFNMKWLQKYVAVLMLLVVLLPIASAITYPTLNVYVTDNANIIGSDYKQKIADLADKINKETTVEIAVLTVQSLEGDTPENYALNVFRQNGVGKKDNNNGLLILVAKNERKYKFEVGYGLEGTIPDAMKVPIGDKIITPNFKQGEYGKGIYESMIVIEGLVTNNTEVLSKYGLINSNVNSGSGGADASRIFIFILFVIFGIAVVLFMARDITRNSGKASGKASDKASDKANSSPPSLPTTYRPPPYSKSRNSSNHRRSNYSNYSSGNINHSHSSFGGGFGGFGGGRSGGGGFGGGW